MNCSIGLVVLACVFVSASCETCTVNSDCNSTTCSAGSVVICQHSDPNEGIVDNGGLCTCEQTMSGECSGPKDCYGTNAPNLSCPDNARHCYDQKCICDRFPIGK